MYTKINVNFLYIRRNELGFTFIFYILHSSYFLLNLFNIPTCDLFTCMCIYIYIYMFYTILHLLESLIIVLHYSTLHVCIMLYYVSSLEKNGMYICIIFFKYI